MYIENLKIEKFRAVENVEFNFGADNINALGGDNGIGKTSVLDSMLWILSDETLVCGKDNTKNLDDNDKTKPIVVELTLVKADGSKLELKREYKALFKEDGTFRDYSNLFWINEAKYSIGEYFKRLKKEFNIDNSLDGIKGFNILRALIDFDYFGTLDYKIAREVIENILHLENAEDIINKQEYMSIKNDLIGQNYDIAKMKTTYNSQKSAQENEILKTKTSIDTLKENATPFNKEEYEATKESYETLKGKEYEHSIEYKSACDEINQKVQKRSLVYNQLEQMEKDLNVIKMKNDNVLKPLETKEKEVEELRKDFVKVQKSVRKCPNCNFELNKEDVVNELKQISLRGKTLNKEIEELKSLVKTEEIKKIEVLYNNKKEEFKTIDNELNELRDKFNSILVKEDEEQQSFYQEKSNKLNELSNKLMEMENSSNTNTIEKLTKELNVQKENLAKIEVKQELLVDFEKEKIQAIQNKVDEVFPGIEFVLTEVSDRGAEKKTCRPTYKGVDYQRLNDGQRIKIGFEIIDDLNRALSIFDTLPIIFDKLRDLSKDNTMSLKDITKSQIFTTYVSSEQEIKLYQI